MTIDPTLGNAGLMFIDQDGMGEMEDSDELSLLDHTKERVSKKTVLNNC